MPKGKRRRKKGILDAKVDTIIRLLEDLFILHAASSRLGTNKIQSVLGIRRARVSNIVTGVNRARRQGGSEG